MFHSFVPALRCRTFEAATNTHGSTPLVSKRTLVETALLMVAFIWALNFSVIKASLEWMEPFPFNGLRFLFATAVVWGALWWKGQKLRIPRKDWLPLLGMGLMGNLLYQGLFIIGIDFTLSANAAVMLGTIPVWVALFSHLAGTERMNLVKGMGVLFAFGGIVFILSGGENELSLGSDTFTGDLIIILAAMVWGAFTMMSKPFLERYTPIQFSVIVTSVGCVALMGAGLPGILRIEWAAVPAAAWAGVVYSGLLSIGAAYVVWNYGIQTVGAVHTSTYQNLVPVMGLLFGVLLLGERLTAVQYAGSALVICGIVLARWKKSRKR